MKNVFSISMLFLVLLSCKKEVEFGTNIITFKDVLSDKVTVNINTVTTSSLTKTIGVCFSTAPEPTVSSGINTSLEVSLTRGNNSTDVLVENLLPETVYYVRSYVNNSGEIIYSEERQISTAATPVHSIILNPISGSQFYSFQVHYDLTIDSPSEGEYSTGLCCSLFPNPEKNTITTVEVLENLTVGSNLVDGFLKGLLPNTHYYVRGFIETENGIIYSTEYEFDSADYEDWGCGINPNSLNIYGTLTEQMSTLAYTQYNNNHVFSSYFGQAANPNALQFTFKEFPTTSAVYYSTTSMDFIGNGVKVVFAYDNFNCNYSFVENQNIHVKVSGPSIEITACDLYPNTQSGCTPINNVSAILRNY